MKKLFVALCLAALIVSACQAAKAQPNPEASPTITEAKASPTLTAPTETAIPTITASPEESQPTTLAATATTDRLSTPAPIPLSATLAAGEVIVNQVDQIMGTWKGTYGWRSGPGYLNFRPDESFTLSPSADGKNGASGEYHLEGTELHINDFFCGSDDGIYEVRLRSGEDQTLVLQFLLFQEECKARSNRLLNRGESWHFLVEAAEDSSRYRSSTRALVGTRVCVTIEAPGHV